MRLLPAILLATAIVLAPVIWLFGSWMMSPSTSGLTSAPVGSAVDSGARIEIEMMRQQMEELQRRLENVEREVVRLQNMPRGDVGAVAMDGSSVDGPMERTGENAIADSYAQVVLIAGRRKINDGISVSSPRFLKDLLGSPREVLSDDCESMTNPKLKEMLITGDVGPIRVSMLRPAIESLTRVFERVKATDIDLYNRISTAGALCVRRIRGSQSSVSTHAFGLAVDLNIDGVLDSLGDGKTQLGLTILSDFFQEEGWFWGAAFSREDSMHFEVSREMLTKWRAAGEI